MNIIFFGSGYINSAAMQLSRVIAGEEECNWAGFIDSFKLIVEMHRIEPKYSLEKYYKTKNPLPISFYFRKIPKDVIDMFELLSKTEGILPALESAHALAYLYKQKGKFNSDTIAVVNLSGRGDKDVGIVEKYRHLK